MKRIENIEEHVKREKPHVTTGRSMDKRILDDSYTAMDEKLATSTKGPVAVILPGGVIRFAAAAAVIIVVAGLFLTRDRQTPNGPLPQPQFAAQSPTMIVSMMSLRTTYQRGGLEALDRQFSKTLDQFGPGPNSLSMRQLLEVSNGS